MNILVAIANHGTKNLKYLQVLLAEYQRMSFHVDIVILSNESKELGSNVEVLVGLPTKNPWSLPFGHKTLFAQRIKDYDLFIYTEDDTLITERNISAYIDAVAILPDDQIAGFLRYEADKDGNRYISSAHGRFHWQPESAKQISGQYFRTIHKRPLSVFYSDPQAAGTRDCLRRVPDGTLRRAIWHARNCCNRPLHSLRLYQSRQRLAN